MRNRWAGQVFDTSGEEIAAALRDVSIPTLMMSLVHVTGDPELIRGALKPGGCFLSEVQGFISEDDKEKVRVLALDVLRSYRDRGCPEPAPPSPELLREMMAWLVCEPVPEEYIPLLLEEMELDGADARVEPAPKAQAARDAFPVAAVRQAPVLQERGRRDPRTQPVASGRLLAVDEAGRPRGLRAAMTIDLGTRHLDARVRYGVPWLRIDRPEKRNATTQDTFLGLKRAAIVADTAREIDVPCGSPPPTADLRAARARCVRS